MRSGPAASVIVVGVGIFGTFTGYLANLFLAPKPPEQEPGARYSRALPYELHVESRRDSLGGLELIFGNTGDTGAFRDPIIDADALQIAHDSPSNAMAKRCSQTCTRTTSRSN